tara:strand:- start:449 stop:976 length:528 start_codon:yes stop_codon:yes gene_type:complete
MDLQIILGPMFSGKSTELIRIIGRYDAINKSTLLINHTLDTRTDESVKTHSNIKRKAIKTNKLMDIYKTESFQKAEVIGIDEGNFYEDLHEFICKCENLKKIIVIVGLDGDYRKQKFGQVLDCIPKCNNITKLNALCMICKDGTPGIFTKRIAKDNKQILVGADDAYMSVCRNCY